MEFPKKGRGVGPLIPSFLNTVKGTTQNLNEIRYSRLIT